MQPAAAGVCRNCGAAASGTYCPNCGQETSLALPTVRAMLREAAGRYVAFDGRMWRTFFALLFRPGFLTREYFAGRRRRYIRPARLFLVLSIGLFALLRFEGKVPNLIESDASTAKQDNATRQAEGKSGHSRTGFSVDPNFGVHLDSDPETEAALKEFGGSWLAPLRQRAEQFNKLSRQEKTEQLFAGVMRYGPYAMFVLLPLFALLMKIVYLGRGRRYPARPRRYAAHLVFGAHSHAFVFLVVALLALLPSGPLSGLVMLWASRLSAAVEHAVYGGRWSGVLLRAAAVFFPYTILFGLSVAGVVVAAILLR